MPPIAAVTAHSQPAGFITYALEHGLREDLRSDRFPSQLQAWKGARLALRAGASHFGLVHRGSAILRCTSGSFTLRAGMYFCVPGEGEVDSDGSGVVMSRLGYEGMFMLGGPAEDKGRLRYIDGCTDSLLVPPVRCGDPCLNLLHIPPQTIQSPHTHGSLRLGLILSGTGECLTAAGRTALAPGKMFVIPAGTRHSFNTTTQALRVLAYHPDSDTGPTDENHPMINRTDVLGEPRSVELP